MRNNKDNAELNPYFTSKTFNTTFNLSIHLRQAYLVYNNAASSSLKGTLLAFIISLASHQNSEYSLNTPEKESNLFSTGSG